MTLNFANYEKKLNESGETKRGLAIICRVDQSGLINEIEHFPDRAWFKVSNLSNVSGLPDNYFDLVLWSDCDLETELRKIKSIWSKLKNGCKIYFDNLLTEFSSIFEKCLSAQERESVLSVRDMTKILKHVLSGLEPNFTVNTVSHARAQYLVLIKQAKIEEPEEPEEPEESEEPEEPEESEEPEEPEESEEPEEPEESEESEEPEEFEEPEESEESEESDEESGWEESEELLEEYPELEEIPGEVIPPIMLPGLKNYSGFSCFMDSILFPIFLRRNSYFSQNLLHKELTLDNVRACSFFDDDQEEGLEYLKNFQNELRKLSVLIKSSTDPDLTCVPIIQQMKKCGDIQEELLGGRQQDDSEFIIALMSMFDLNPTRINIIREVSKNMRDWVESSNKTEEVRVLEVNIPQKPDEISSLYQSVQTFDYSKTSPDSWPLGPDSGRYPHVREKKTILSSEALLFHLVRKVGLRKKDTRPIEFVKYIKNTKTGKNYELQIITIHKGSAEGGHYTAYFKYKSAWFYYDDTEIQRVVPVSWDVVYGVGSKYGSLFMYFPI